MTAYGTAQACADYHAERGNTAWADAAASPDDAREAARVKGSDYVDSYRDQFWGTKTDGRAQQREWPRINSRDRSGEKIDVSEIPIEAEHASYEAALLVIQGEDLFPTQARGGLVKRQRDKGGPAETETEYSDGAPARTTYESVMAVLRPLLRSHQTLLRV